MLLIIHILVGILHLFHIDVVQCTLMAYKMINYLVKIQKDRLNQKYSIYLLMMDAQDIKKLIS
jgi:hypothetical protein